MRPPLSSAISPTVSSSRYRSCETATTEPPNERIRLSMRSRASTSRCASGSSSSSTSGSRKRHAARPTSLRCPPESTRVGFSRSASSRPTSTRSARARPSKPGPPTAVQRSISSSWRRSARVIRSRSLPSSLICASTRSSSSSSSSMSGRAARNVCSESRASPSICCGRYATTSPRRAVSSPASGCSSPARIRMSVDLPPPFGPIMPRRTPASTSRSTPRRIEREPKLFAMPRACRSAMQPA
jgi:hypothetical protein